MNDESDIAILSDILDTLVLQPDASQRELAEKNRLSLGMTNALLKRFASKGWIMIKRLSARKVCYALTPEGMKVVAQRTRNYMQRTFALMDNYSRAVFRNIAKAKQAGCTKVILYGRSDIEFLIEHACKCEGLELIIREVTENTVPGKECFCVVSEQSEEKTIAAMVKRGCKTTFELAEMK